MVLVRLIEKYINFAGKNGAKFLRTPVFFLGLSVLKLAQTKFEITEN